MKNIKAKCSALYYKLRAQGLDHSYALAIVIEVAMKAALPSKVASTTPENSFLKLLE